MKKYFCGLDELFDTRLGLISLIKPEVAQKIFEAQGEDYLYRMHDEYFWKCLNITEEEWYRYWGQRNVNVLRNSLRTHIISVIADSIMMYYNDREEALSSKKVTLTLNLYPYQLSEDELDTLKEVILEHIPVLKDVEYVNYTLHQLTANVLKEYDECYLYEYHRWMDIHGKVLRDMMLTGITLRVPRLFYQVPTDEEYQEVMNTPEGKKIIELDIFKLTEAAMSMKIQVTHIAASDFSVALFPPIHKSSEIKDLDSRQDPSDTGIVDKSLFDPQV